MARAQEIRVVCVAVEGNCLSVSVAGSLVYVYISGYYYYASTKPVPYDFMCLSKHLLLLTKHWRGEKHMPGCEAAGTL